MKSIFITFIVSLMLGLAIPLPKVEQTIKHSPQPAPFLPSLSRSTPTSTKLLFLGDIMLGRSVNTQIIKKSDPSWPLRGLFSYTQAADLVFANLESPLINTCPSTDTGFKFCGRKENVQGLVEAGIDLLGIANNHIGNYGAEGIVETIMILEEAGIKVVGTHLDPVVLETGGTTYAFFAANDIGATPSTINTLAPAFFTRVKASRDLGHFVIVGVHWGVEYTHEPTSRQRQLSAQLFDSGAQIVVGHHPHWTQPVERVGDNLVIYSLGNTVFDQEWSRETKTGQLVEVEVVGGALDSFRTIPIYLKNYGEASLTEN